VRQVLINLLSNAVKFTDAGEVSLRVSARRQHGDGVIITIRVQDSGIGIPEHLHHRLFRQFSQIDTTMARQHGGTGLGLAISQRLSRLLGGSISVRSQEDRGSTFTFIFAARVAPPPAADPFPGSLAGLRVRTVLKPGIVGEQIASLLTHWGASVTTAADCSSVNVLVMDEEAVAPAAADGDGNATPTILVTNLRPATADRSEPEPEYVIIKPVRARALHEALCEASGRDAQAEQDRAGVSPPPLIQLQGLAVLLVEDDDANRRVVHLMLQELGLDVDEARSGFEAINHARRRQYDVILMDVQMPGCDGLEATRQIRSEKSGAAPLIYALTANIMEDDEARCRAAGMNGYLSKPLRLSTLASVLNRFVAQRA
jgi:CheY-like chemotaxis protein/anti-sigma regulatory factor (Ser/Thr protein kinase)